MIVTSPPPVQLHGYYERVHDYVLALIKRRASNAGPSAGSSAAGVAPGTEAQAVPELTVCETGFNGGHSAVMFVEAALEAADEVLARGAGAQTGGTHAGLRTLGFQYVGWDLGTVPAAKQAQSYLARVYDSRIHVEWGDSRDGLPSYLRRHTSMRCDVISIDGEHTEEGVAADLAHLVPRAKEGALVFIDDCAFPNTGMVRSYDAYVRSGHIKDLERFVNTNRGSPGWCFGVVAKPGHL